MEVIKDRTQRLLARYALSSYAIPPDTAHEVKRRMIDSFGVMCAALHDDAPQAARAYAGLFPHKPGARVFGLAQNAAPEIAGFTNGVHVRYLDYNDTYLSLEPLHPSDSLPPLLALAEWLGSSGAELIAAVAVAYEISMNLCDAASLRLHGWDHVNYIGLGVAAGAARLLGLDLEGTEHALSLALVPHAAMRQTRAGELSMWEGAAAANSARNGLFAALLVGRGFTGPYEPFEGEMGIFKQLFGGEVFREEALRSMEAGAPPRRVCDSYIKAFPVEFLAQSAVESARLLHAQTGGWENIEAVEIETFKVSYEIIAKDPEKWRPTTRETADHSLMYITAVGLVDGDVTRDSFSSGRLQDERIRTLLERTKVQENERLTDIYPDGIPNVITLHTKDGRELRSEVRYPRGHAGNPMNDEEVVGKFERNRAGVLNDKAAGKLLKMVWKLEQLESLRQLTALWPVVEEMPG